MNVCLTIDVECYRGDYEREVYGGGLGLAYVLEQCRHHRVTATFFVEALGATRWGLDETSRICDMIREAGQEVQLHLHPVVADIDGFRDDHDLISAQPVSVQAMLIETGCAVLRKCGVETVSALRCGDFAANGDTLDAMRQAGLRVSSNRDLDAKCSTRSVLNETFRVRNDIAESDGVVDVPVTACRTCVPFWDGPYRHMEISAMGLSEMIDSLKKLAKAGYQCATLLTHPGEFFNGVGCGRRPIEKNRKRLEGILRLLAAHPDMVVRPVTACAVAMNVARDQPQDVVVNPLATMRRVVEQGLYRMRRAW